MALLLVVVPLLTVCPTWAQESETFKAEELDQMLAPIALYPDSLLAQILMACTYPAEVAEAAQWSQSNSKQKGDAAVTAVQEKALGPQREVAGGLSAGPGDHGLGAGMGAESGRRLSRPAQ
jgi:hypothetical protein